MTVVVWPLREYQTPCILRTSTRVESLRGPVTLGDLPPTRHRPKERHQGPVQPGGDSCRCRKRAGPARKTERLDGEAVASALNFTMCEGKWGVSPAGFLSLRAGSFA